MSFTLTPSASLIALASSSGTRAKATERFGPIDWLNGVRGAVSGTAPCLVSSSRMLRTSVVTDPSVRVTSGTTSRARRSFDMVA